MINHRISSYTRRLVIGLLFALAIAATGCAPKPKTAVDLQVERLVQGERDIGQKIDDLEARASKLKADCANAWNGK